jgi:hypothetical protein
MQLEQTKPPKESRTASSVLADSGARFANLIGQLLASRWIAQSAHGRRQATPRPLGKSSQPITRIKEDA